MHNSDVTAVTTRVAPGLPEQESFLTILIVNYLYDDRIKSLLTFFHFYFSAWPQSIEFLRFFS